MDAEICLTCLRKPNKSHSLDEVFLDNNKILEMLHQLVPLFLEQIHPLPDRICDTCVEKLVISYNFQKQCLNSVHNLKKNSFKRMAKTQNESEPKTENDDTVFEKNEFLCSEESTMESLPKIKQDLKSSLDKVAKDSSTASTQDVEKSFEQHDNKSEETPLKLCGEAKRSSSVKLHSNENSKNLHEQNHSHDVEATSVDTNQCKLCDKIFKQPQGLASHMSKTHLKKHLYQCRKCEKGFSVEELFIRHCNSHLGIKHFQCSQCDKAFETKSRLNQHLLCHSKDSSYLCTFCGKRFHRIDVFKQHMMRHDDEKLFKCSKCAINFKSFSEHIKHMKTHKTEESSNGEICDKPLSATTSNQQITNTDEKLFQCDLCDKDFNSVKNLKLHKERHNRNKSYQCKYCSKVFFHRNYIKKHTKRMHKEEYCELEDDITMKSLNEIKNEQEMPLEQILIEFKSEKVEETESSESAEEIQGEENVHVKLEQNEKVSEKDLTVHPQTLLNNSKEEESISMASTESAAQCDLCNQKFKNSHGLARHRSSTHFKKHLYQCDQCDRGFSVEEIYIKHRNRHLGIKMFKCSQCDKAFETNSILNQHLITHSKLTPHLCTTCGKRFRRIDGLRQHMRRHGDERPFKCSTCPKSFKCLSDKLKHMSIHDEKRYVCNICGTRLATPESLSQHQMTHTGEKPFKCSHCDKSFISLSNMKCHERIHTGEKPYKCQYCWKTFRQSNDRNKHATRMHKNEMINAKAGQNRKAETEQKLQ